MKIEFTLTLGLLLATHLACSGSDGEPPASVPGGGGAAVGGNGAAGTAGSNSAGSPAVPGGAGGAGQGGAGGTTLGGTGGGGAGTTAAGAGAGTTAGGGVGATGGGGASSGAGGAAGGMDGQALYAANCAACHGQQGAGGPLAPELQHPVRDYSNWVVRHGRAMTKFPAPMLAVTTDKLSDANLSAIWDYLDAPPQPTTGEGLYLDYCGNCHGADGKGGPTTRNILNELGNLERQVREGAHLGEFDMRREYMPAFGATRLTDAELDRISMHVQGL